MKDIYSFRRSTMAKIQSKTDVQLKKESEDLYAARKAGEDALVAAYNDKKLKSKMFVIFGLIYFIFLKGCCKS